MPSSMTTQFVLSLLPEPMADYIATHILHPRSPFQIYGKEALTQAQRGYETLYPHLEPYYNQAVDAMSDPDGPGAYLALVPLVLTAIAAVMVVSYVVRIMTWWTRFVTRMAFYAFLLALLAMVWDRGLFQSLRDVVVIVSKLAGYGAAVKNIWLEEYQRYEAQQARATGRSSRTHR